MKCVIPGLNVKVLARAIHALCRIGDELYVEPESSSLALRAVSASKSAYAAFTFFESFFSYYSYEQPSSQEEDVTCKVSMKSCLTVFRSPTHLDKQVELCQIRLDPNDVKLVFEFHCRHGIVKTHYLPIIECETLEAVYSKDMVPNRLVVQPKVLTFALMNFQATLELTFIVTPQKMQLRNYVEDEEDLKQTVRTELCLEPGEFDHYSIGVDTEVTFCLREFRALLMFAEAVGLPISANFETGGRPIIFIVKNDPTFESNFVFATLMPNNQTNSSQCSSQTVKCGNKVNKSRAKVNKFNTPATSSEKKLKGKNLDTDMEIDSNFANPGPSTSNNHFQESDLIQNNTELLRININAKEQDVDIDNEEDKDEVPGTPHSPPSKRARYIFQRCFQDTYNSQMIPGYDEVLAEDSDEDSTKRT